MRIYISGPMSGIPEFNHPAFHEAALNLRLKGHEVINPAEMDEDIDKPWPWYILRDLHVLADFKPQAIFMLHGWDRSPGAKIEMLFAEKLGARILYQAE